MPPESRRVLWPGGFCVCSSSCHSAPPAFCEQVLQWAASKVGRKTLGSTKAFCFPGGYDFLSLLKECLPSRAFFFIYDDKGFFSPSCWKDSSPVLPSTFYNIFTKPYVDQDCVHKITHSSLSPLKKWVFNGTYQHQINMASLREASHPHGRKFLGSCC